MEYIIVVHNQRFYVYSIHIGNKVLVYVCVCVRARVCVYV